MLRSHAPNVSAVNQLGECRLPEELIEPVFEWFSALGLLVVRGEKTTERVF